ncbi:substrate-binding domain-containing protein [Neptunicoccus cionae]|uniref:Tungsten ABC transporter substrate-binding protein n=1 Tax=Neptunicoccus cionae TaxID=2035344 RepID=A0A916QZV8_9RHOB|nr:substrate-binding domain-containing protein [Amylibacter cionae]GGA22696.1 tungsten ABC transporter substrate-binding protein [Amylibacter cionae]
MRIFKFLGSLAVFAVAGNLVLADPARVLVQSTTSTENSGLYAYLLPLFEAETGLRVDVVSVGTGQAINNARNGDADVLLVHAKAAEEAFVADGYGVERFDLMYNDFVLVGPKTDPDGLRVVETLPDLLGKIAVSGTPFFSRGDDSGTHKKERSLWADAGVDVESADGQWYRETGAGMGATLRIAVESEGYTLTDRATWIAFAGKDQHDILFAGDAALFNQYGIIAVNPERHPHVNAQGAQMFLHWMLSEAGQSLIAAYTRDGQQLFFPNGAGNAGTH